MYYPLPLKDKGTLTRVSLSQPNTLDIYAIVEIKTPKCFIILLTDIKLIGEAVFAENLPLIINNCCDSTTHCITYPYDFPNLYEVRCCNYEPSCVASITDVTSGDEAYCNSYVTSFIWSVIRSYCDTPTIPLTCLSAYMPSALQVLQVLVL
jgi:hypothetical protein